jgi:dihydrofolate reductase
MAPHQRPYHAEGVHMRKIVVSEFMSLDGVIEAPGADGSGYQYAGWTVPYSNEQFMEFKSDELRASDILLLGRTTYEGFAAAWPKMSGDEFSDKMNSMPKYVVSTTLTTADWTNSHIIGGDISQEVAKLKQQDGKDILVFGSGMLTRELLKQGLVDELRLLVYPIVLGSGKQLFKDSQKIPLKLTHSEVFDTGVVLLKYEPEKK